MELAVVSIESQSAVPNATLLQRVAIRLAGTRRSEVVSTAAFASTASFLAQRMNTMATSVNAIDFATLITSRAGSDVVAVCDALAVRDLAADILDVDPAAVPVPLPYSLTVIRASRSGVRSLICLNDTMHLVDGQLIDRLSKAQREPIAKERERWSTSR